MERRYFKPNVSLEDALEWYWSRHIVEFNQIKKEIKNDFKIDISMEKVQKTFLELDMKMFNYLNKEETNNESNKINNLSKQS